MSERPTPRTDAVSLNERDGVTHPDLCETYIAWTDYWALRKHARQLERDLDEAVALLREWRATELDSQDEEFMPWIESFEKRIDALLARLAKENGK